MIINLKPIPYYTGTKVLDNETYRLTIRWNIRTENWYMDIDGITANVAIHGMALLPGKDLLKKSGYSQLGQLFVIDNSNANEKPNFDEIGGRFTLEYTPV
ncbi:hypothetical protein KAR91_53410 [Candidatus Pacearchaeota archaeon]|nr:hypothetical protein [Candidatus Pacearchaeota archaeon]